jgi:uncharacterized protein (TIGR02611 family)
LLKLTYVALRRSLVFLIGITIVIIGVIMLVTPGPAIIVIPAGLAVLATEFLWARRLLTQLKESISKRARRKTNDSTQSTQD